MIITKTLIQIGNSLGIVIDKYILNNQKLEKGDLVEVSFKKVKP